MRLLIVLLLAWAITALLLSFFWPLYASLALLAGALVMVGTPYLLTGWFLRRGSARVQSRRAEIITTAIVSIGSTATLVAIARWSGLVVTDSPTIGQDAIGVLVIGLAIAVIVDRSRTHRSAVPRSAED
ncbi:MAG: hypothetical protein ACRDF7_00845 [Candidatus Limnocylindrales bacterium]